MSTRTAPHLRPQRHSSLVGRLSEYLVTLGTLSKNKKTNVNGKIHTSDRLDFYLADKGDILFGHNW